MPEPDVLHHSDQSFCKKEVLSTQGSQTMQILHPDATDGETQVETGCQDVLWCDH